MDVKRVVVVGIPGVGKSTVVSKTRDMLSSRGLNVDYVVFGTVMMKEAEKMGVKHRDDMRKLPVSEQRRLQVKAASEIADMGSEILLIDTHLFIKTKEGYWPGLPYDVAKALSPTHIILVNATPSEVISRRSRDRERYREIIGEEEVLEEMSIARDMLSTVAVLTGASALIVDNSEGRVDEAAAKIVSALGVT